MATPRSRSDLSGPTAIVALVALLALFALVLGLTVLSPAPASAANRVVAGLPLADPAPTGESGLQGRILFTSNVVGEFEGCACKDLPLGGAAQLAGLIDRERGLPDSPAPGFWFDAGDRFFRIDMAMTGVEEAQRRLQAIFQVDVGNVLGLDAQGVGSLDLGAGLPYLKLLAGRAQYPVLSANLVDDDGALLFEPSVLIKRGDRLVGVTSVLPRDVVGNGYHALDPRAAARAQVTSLREQGAEIVIVLSNLGLKDDKALARASRADLVLGSRSRDITPEGVAVGRGKIGHAGSRGRYLGDVRWFADGPVKGAPLVVTTQPVASDGPVHAMVGSLVARLLVRLADPILGVPGIPYENRDDPRVQEQLR